jgi:hypothetical protein
MRCMIPTTDLARIRALLNGYTGYNKLTIYWYDDFAYVVDTPPEDAELRYCQSHLIWESSYELHT